MKSPFERRIARATELIGSHPSARELLAFFVELAKFQKTIFELDSSDIHDLTPHFPAVIDLTKRFAAPLAAFAQENLNDSTSRQQALEQHWNNANNQADLDPRAEFFVHVLLEPFAMRLALRGQIDPHWTDPACPFCGSRPGMAVLRGEGDGGKRWLKCSLCSTEWQFRRILCPNCGEEDKEKLPVYVAKEFEHVRVEACDTCKTYLKAIDLTKDGHADPIVDEIVTVPLNIWAEKHGYVKLAPNLMGM